MRAPTRITRAGMRLVPWWTVNRAPSRIGSSSSSATSRRYDRGNAPGAASASPRRTSRRSTPARLTATRWPALGALDRARRGPARSARAPRVPAGSSASRSSRRDRARPQRAGHHRADAADREGAVDVQQRRAGAVRHGPAGARRRGRAPRAASSMPGARARRAGDDLGAGSSSAASASAAARRGSARSAFVTATTPSVTPSAASTAACSRVWGITPSSAATTMRIQVDPGRAGDHRAHEALVAGHVDDRQPPAGRQRERRVAELDRDAARLLLRQPVGVDRRSARATSAVLPWSMCPAVPSVSGMRPELRHVRARRRRHRVGLVVGQRARVEQQPPVGDAPDDRRGRRRAGGSASASLDRAPRRPAARAAAARRRRPCRPSPRRLRRRSARRRRRARALELVGRRLEHPQHRELGARALGVAVAGASVASSAASESLSMRSARGERVAPARARSRRARRPERRPAGRRAACRRRSRRASAPAATRAAHRSARRDKQRELVGRARRSRRRRSPAPASAQSASISTSSVKPSDAEVRRVDAQDRPGVLARAPARSRRSRVRFVVPTSTSRAPDCATTSGMRKPPPISMSSPARDDDLAPAGERRERRAAPRPRCC